MDRTKRFPINRLILEGPDLAGKTSFYNRLHELTRYKWNIQDRSALSMLIYAKLYGRDTFIEVERLNTEIKNLNNKMIILLPPWDEIGRRFNERGDEIQNLASLKKLYDLFSKAAEEFQDYPNVIVIRSKDTLSWADQTIKTLIGDEMTTINDAHECVQQLSRASSNFEATPVNMTLYDDGKFKYCDPSVLLYKPEQQYYASILSKVVSKIECELTGKNEYNRKEELTSRRFVYASDTCISFGQFMVRNDVFDCHFVLRSSNAKDTLPYDIKFLYYLCSKVYDQLGITETMLRMRINFNSAHIIISKETEEK